MTRTTILLLAMLVPASVPAAGQPAQAPTKEPGHGLVTSVRSLMLSDGRMYLPAGYPHNTEPYQEPLRKLWDAQPPEERHIDSFAQPWVKLDVETLVPILGEIPRAFTVLVPDIIRNQPLGPCDEDDRCAPAVGEFRSASIEVQGAALFRWGCDGTTLVPVLDLGDWRWTPTHGWPTATALSLASPGAVEVSALDPEELPDAASEVSVHFKGVLLSGPGGERAFLIYFLDATGADNFMVLQQGKSGLQTLGERGPFDISC